MIFSISTVLTKPYVNHMQVNMLQINIPEAPHGEQPPHHTTHDPPGHWPTRPHDQSSHSCIPTSQSHQKSNNKEAEAKQQDKLI